MERMRTIGLSLSLAAVLIFSAAGTLSAQTTEESLRQNFPNVKFEKIQPSPIKGIYEVIMKGGVIYYAPESQSIISGEIYAKDGRNLTQERRMEMIRGKVKDIPLEKGLKMGTGPSTVIEFSNPDCSYCRQASKYLAGKKDLTRYVFFLPFNPQTERKVKQILCAADRVKAYEDFMTGKPDTQKMEVCNSKEIDELMKVHKDLAQHLGINATPFFVIGDQVVQGADMPALERLLGKK
jgi:thiol:disulfide interchange protein DsbC